MTLVTTGRSPGASAADGPSSHRTDEIGTRLLAAAADVFAERGYDKAGVAEIARRAGVTTGAIYSRYAGKADLLVEAIDPHAEDQLEALFADHRFQGRMEDILLTAGTQLVKDPDADCGPLLLETFAAARRHPEVAEVLRVRVLERQQRLTEIVEAAKADGGISDDIDTGSLVTFCHAVGFGFLLFEPLGLELPAPGAWEQLITRLIAAVAPPQTSPTPSLDRPEPAQKGKPQS